MFQDGAFQSTKIRELYMIDCDIYNVSSEAFKGLETYLHTLDVSNNNITDFPLRKLQQSFSMLMKLGLRDNKIKQLFPIYKEEHPKIEKKTNDKKKTKDKTVDREDNKGASRDNNNHNEFFSLQDFDFSGWHNGPLHINSINGYALIYDK